LTSAVLDLEVVLAKSYRYHHHRHHLYPRVHYRHSYTGCTSAIWVFCGLRECGVL